MKTKTFELSTVQPEACYYEESLKLILHDDLSKMLRDSDYFGQMEFDELEDFEKSVRSRDCFGWLQFDKEPQEIHAWLSDEIDPESFFWFMGHEIGHMIEDTFRNKVVMMKDPDWRVEQLADNYALAASLTYEIYKFCFGDPNKKES